MELKVKNTSEYKEISIEETFKYRIKMAYSKLLINC